MAPDDLADAVDFVYESKIEYLQRREEAKRFARQVTGLTAGDLARLENAGYDLASGRRVGGATAGKLADFDVHAVEVARQYPDLGLGDPDRGDDVARAVWDLLREGSQPPPTKYSDEILDAALHLLWRASEWKARHPVEQEEEIPFARAADAELRRYGRWLARFAKRYSQQEGPREGDRRIDEAGNELVFHDHRWRRPEELSPTRPAAFVSPNVGPAMTVAEARRRLRSSGHHWAKRVFWGICRQQGIEPLAAVDTIGVWRGGAENSILLVFRKIAWPELRVLAARIGLEARQEGVAIFQMDPQGIFARWQARLRMRAEDLEAPLLDHGIKNWTVVEYPSGLEVIVCGEKEFLASVTEQLGRLLRPVQSEVIPGQFEVISAKTRTKAAALFRSIIQGHEAYQMAADKKIPWFLEDLSGASPKVQAWAEIMRRGYEFSLLPPEEQKRRLARADEIFRRAGVKILVPEPDDLDQATIEGSGRDSNISGEPGAGSQEPGAASREQ